MTRQGAPTPPSSNDVEYVRKLALAILSTLQSRGLLSAEDVDAILIAARRAAQGSPERSPDVPSRVPQITVRPSSPPAHLSWQVTPPPASPQADGANGEETPPPVIDINLD
ncbi:hypothetical protein [Deinococcus sp. YIM 77859]|uniref:hypothetical protein n=1 Tax=Deinococcus sp. YIM 77859 TaxID=1540221 RepID=UPI0005584BD8|nr:hypothetical protein [Deinococcus sp. YIM 77859]